MKIQTVFRRCSKNILVLALVLALFYYRFCQQVLALRGVDHWNVLLQGIILLLFMIGITGKPRQRTSTQLTKIVWGMFVYISLISIIYWTDYSGFLGAVIWCVYFFVTFLYYSAEEDDSILQFSSIIICVMTVITGYLTLDIGYIVGASSGLDEAISFENIAGIILTTIPMIMTLRAKLLKWILILVILIVSVVSARRMAVISSFLVVIFSLPELLQRGKHKVLYILSFVVFIIGGYYLLTGIFQESLSFASERLGNYSDDGGSGRVDIWSKVFVLLSNNNIFEWIVGHGYLGVSRFSNSTAAHNEFLEYLFDYGVIGLIMLIMMHVALVKRMISLFYAKSNLRYSYLISWIILLLYQLFGNVLIYAQYCLPMVVYWGFVEAKILEEKKRSYKFN